MKIKKAYEERENYRTELNGQNRMDRIAAQAQAEAEAKSLGIEGVNKTYLEGTQNRVKGGVRTKLGTSGVLLELLKKRYGDNVGLSDRGQVYRIETIDKNAPKSANNQRIVNIDVDISGLRKAVNDYITSYRTETQTDKDVDERFDSEYTWTDPDGKKHKLSEFNIDDYNQKVQEARWKRKGTLGNDAPDKAAAAAARKAAQDAKAAARKELKDAETETNAIIAKVEEWYTLQQNVVTQAYNDGELTEQQMQNINQQLEAVKQQALAAARRSLSGQDTQTWETFKAQMGTLMLDQSEWSKELLTDIQDVNMTALRDALMRFDGKKSLDKWGFSSTAFRDGLNKNAAKNEAKVKEIGAKAQKEVEKLLDQYHFVEQAIKGFSDSLSQMGILTETARSMAKKLADANNVETLYSEKDYKADLQQQETSRRAALQTFLDSGTRPYAVNPENTADLDKWLRDLTGAEFGGIGAQGMEFKFSSWAEAFRDDFTLWLKDSEKYKAQIQEFYFALLGSSDEYYKAQHQQYEFYKKQNEQQWENSGRKEFYDQTYTMLDNQQKVQDTFGTGQSFGQQYGFADAIANDPEVELYKKKLQAAAEYYQFVESHQHTEQELREAGQATLEAYLAMAQKVSDEVAERASKIQELQQPATEFAENVGQKLGDMIFNMESQSMTWSQIVKKMILAFAQMTIKMTAENLTKKIQMALFYKQMQAMEIEHQTTMLGIQTAFGAMQIGAQQTINTTKQVAQTADNTTTIAKEVSLATALTALGISEGAAKTIGALGWWGIPLIAVIASLLMGLLASALSSAGSSSAETASTGSSGATKTKLVSGMLTYDSGNVQTILGSDGRVYRARPEQELKTGLVTQPIAAPVNGQQALVGERGPEIVIGRQTTQAIMMNEPELLQHLLDLDQGRRSLPYRAYAAGNLQETVEPVAVPQQQTDPSASDSDLRQTLSQMQSVMQSVLYYLQNPVSPEINMYGDNGLRKKLRQADRLMSRYE